MKIEKARERIKHLQEYVDSYDQYQPKGMKEMAIKLYAELNNVSEVAKLLNDEGYRKEGKLVAGKRGQVKLISNDITDIINGEVAEEDHLHSEIKRILKQNRKRKGIQV